MVQWYSQLLGQIQEEFEIINGEDAHTISMIQELDPSIPQ
jgi:hypothetical protein